MGGPSSLFTLQRRILGDLTQAAIGGTEWLTTSAACRCKYNDCYSMSQSIQQYHNQLSMIEAGRRFPYKILNNFGRLSSIKFDSIANSQHSQRITLVIGTSLVMRQRWLISQWLNIPWQTNNMWSTKYTQRNIIRCLEANNYSFWFINFCCTLASHVISCCEAYALLTYFACSYNSGIGSAKLKNSWYYG